MTARAASLCTLSYLREELNLSVERIQRAVEAYLEYPEEASGLLGACETLRQMSGALTLAGEAAASSFVAEIRAVAEALSEGAAQATGRAHAALLRGVLCLKPYLETVHRSRRGTPVMDVAPVIVALRQARGLAAAAQSASGALGATAAGLDRVLVHGLRPDFQKALTLALRGRDLPQQFARAEQVLQRLRDLAATAATYDTWWWALRLVRALRQGLLPPLPANLKLLGAVDRQIKCLIDEGEEGLRADTTRELLGAIEGLLAAAPAAHELLSDRSDYRPPAAADGGELAAPDLETVRQIVDTLAEDLALAQDAVDRVARGQPEAGASEDLLQRLRAGAGVLAMLNLAPTASLLTRVRDALARLDVLDGAHLERLATDLLILEESLQSLNEVGASAAAAVPGAGPFRDQQARGAVARQALRAIGELTELVSSLAAAQDVKGWGALAQPLRGVANVLTMLSWGRAAELARALAALVERPGFVERCLGESTLLDAFAEAILAIEYAILEAEGGAMPSAVRLEFGEACLRRISARLDAPAPTDADVRAAVAAAALPPVTLDLPADVDFDPQPAATPAPPEPELEPLDCVGLEWELETVAQGGSADPGDATAELSGLGQGMAPASSADLELLDGSLPADPASLPPTAEAAKPMDDPRAWASLDAIELPAGGWDEPSEPLRVESWPAAAEGSAAAALELVEPWYDPEQAGAADAEDAEPLEICEEWRPRVEQVVAEPTPAAKPEDRSAEPADLIPLESQLWLPAVLGDTPDQAVGGAVLGEMVAAPAGDYALPIAALIASDPAEDDAPAPAASEPPLAAAGRPAWCGHELLEVFLEEAEDAMAGLAGWLPAWQADLADHRPLREIRRAYHTLKGSGRMLAADKAADFAWRVETLASQVLDRAREPTPAVAQALVQSTAAFHELLRHMQQGNEDVDLAPAIAALEAAAAGRAERPLEPVQVGAPSAGLPMTQAAEAVERAEVDGLPAPAADLLDHQDAGELRSAATAEQRAAAVGDAEQPLDQASAAVTIVAARDGAAAEIASQASSAVDLDLDAELAEVFVQEALDILDASDLVLAQLSRAPDDRSRLNDLRREMHTLKGSSRMAGFLVIGELAHALESLLDDVSRSQLRFTPPVSELLQRALDRLHGMVEVAKGLVQPQPADDLIEQLRECGAGPAPESLHVLSAAAAAAEPLATARAPAPVAPAVEAPAPVGDGSDMVRMSAALLERISNQVGESSINRARIEQGVGGFRSHLGEMGQTLSRLREKLRRLEIETETQILFRYERSNDRLREDFDPLELDRFSELQQLSRSLLEVVNDLASIQGALDEQVQSMDSLLHQQEKIVRDLQENLTRTRMVRFDSLIPRMRRVVRLAAEELGKKAELLVEPGAEVERGLLEHLAGPLEHVLRNAVSHGIERPPLRAEQGKPETGQVTLAIRREGSELVLAVMDDGAGIDFAAVRRKAVEQRLLAAEEPADRETLIACMMQPGFSTASQVTQVSGRGVGMDAIQDAVRSLGGSLAIASEDGQGTRLVLRLPFSLSVTRALLVRAGRESYAIPLAGIDGVVRVEPEAMREYLDDRGGELIWNERRYELRSLGGLLGGSAEGLEDLDRPLPAVLVRSERSALALQVDAVLGSSEVIVKPVGPQVNSVPGVSGATILGDGRVVLVLEPAALLRSLLGRRPGAEVERLREALVGSDQAQLQIMVVDDSITMRKVTSTLLQRHGARVLLAKDGLDAAGQLEDSLPDALVLDIEMPRMDGFELAAHIRNQEHLWHLPIVMVTSRSGDKHRQRAMNLGVNAYLGKPYREEELLTALRQVLGARGVGLR